MDVASTFSLKAVLKDRKALLILLAFSMAISVFYLVPSLLIISIYDRVLTSQSQETLFMLFLIGVLAFVSLGVSEWVRSLIVVRLVNRLDLNLVSRVFQGAMVGHLRQPSGKAVSVLGSMSALRQTLGGPLIFALFDIPWSGLFFIVAFVIHPVFGALIVAAIVLNLGWTWYGIKKTTEQLNAAEASNQQSSQLFLGSVRNAEAVYAMGMLPNLAGRWAGLQVRWLKGQTVASDLGSFVAGASKSLRSALQFLPIAIGAWLVLRGEMSPGAIFAASMLCGRALVPFDMLSGAMKSATTAKAAAVSLSEVLSHSPLAEAQVVLPTPQGILTLTDLVAGPPGVAEPTLRGISLTLRPGTVTALVGPSSCGKTSLIRVMLGIWPATKGEVQVDGASLNQYADTQRGAIFGYLPQEVDLIDGTIAENIARFSQAESEDIIRAAQLANVHEMVTSLPNGYQTPLVNGGKNLSGGYRQRIALARALFGLPKIVFLDEPNSNLDEQGEMALKKAILALKAAQSTVIIVTHRSSLIEVVDHIALIQDGTVKRFGPKTDFMRPAPNDPKAVSA